MGNENEEFVTESAKAEKHNSEHITSERATETY